MRRRGDDARRRRRLAKRVLAKGACIAGLALLPFTFTWVAGPRCELGHTHDAERQLRYLQHAIALFALDHGDCPEVLGALATRGYIDEPTFDPWGRPIDYRCRVVGNGRSVTLASHGADGRPGTHDDVYVEQRVSW